MQSATAAVSVHKTLPSQGPTLLTRCIAAAHHCGEPAIQPLAHAADQRARSEVAAQGQLLALSRQEGRGSKQLL